MYLVLYTQAVKINHHYTVFLQNENINKKSVCKVNNKSYILEGQLEGIVLIIDYPSSQPQLHHFWQKMANSTIEKLYTL